MLGGLRKLNPDWIVTLITINNIAKFSDVIFIDLGLFSFNEG